MTIGDKTYPLDSLFWVLATQNPIEQEGTYPLPEAQMDRFLLKIRVGYPSPEEEGRILDRMGGEPPEPPRAVVGFEKILDVAAIRARHLSRRADPPLHRRPRPRHARAGAVRSRPAPTHTVRRLAPRDPVARARAGRAHAFLEGRAYVTPDDIKTLAPDVFRHRILLTYEAEAEGVPVDEVTRRILARVEVP